MCVCRETAGFRGPYVHEGKNRCRETAGSIEGVKRKKNRKTVCMWGGGDASIILPVFVSACGHPPVSVLLYLSVCVCVATV